ncbi:phage portal protein [Edaphobacillus lindanitolerans]|uniref:Phage portal protein, HK97 family n=1 Tax=Edaphobacillus lindanitolerans TaxID=550447 RepID=A0A1U7PQF6_9BACI|nr:phage portal protein [Edaphobacillus lindanitolerans]SIT90619.1 phage portal protein, HK97 family [Edaphobacillus lindanitolerans]
MANPFAWNRKDGEVPKDYFSTAILTTRPPTSITEAQALKIPAVKAAVELVTNAISTLPVYLYKEVNEREVEKIDDERVSILNHDSNKYETAQMVTKQAVQDYLLRGIAYLYRTDNGIHHLPARNVKVEEFTVDGITVSRKEFIYEGIKTVTLQEHEVMVIDSGTNGILVDGEEILKTATNQVSYTLSLLENSAVPVGVLKASAWLTEAAIKRLRESFTSLYTGPKNTGKTIVLEEGLDFQPLSMKPEELQLSETGKKIISDVARLFNIPESLLNSNANKYNSLEANNVYFLQNTLLPIITALESSFDKHLLTGEEKKNGYYFRFDTSEILRTTEAEKVKTIAEEFKAGLLTLNQSLHKLDLPPEARDFRLLSIGSVMKYSDDNELVFLNLGPTIEQGDVALHEDGTKKPEDRASV